MNTNKQLSQHDFLKMTNTTNTTTTFLNSLPQTQKAITTTIQKNTKQNFENKPKNQLYTIYLQYNTNYNVKIKILKNITTKIDNNPYNPWTL